MAVQSNINRLNGINPLSYMGVNPYTPPDLLIEQREPTENDNNYQIGTLWILQDPHRVWMLLTLIAGVAIWVQIYPQGNAASDVIVTAYKTTGAHVWTPNDNTQYITVYVWGSGQGGASGSVDIAGGLGGVGGIGGGCAKFSGPVIAFGTSVPILVSAGGIGGAPVSIGSGNPGSIGTNTAFGNIVVPPGTGGVFSDMGPAFRGTANGFGSSYSGQKSGGGGVNETSTYYNPENNTYAAATGGGSGGKGDLVTPAVGANGGDYISFGTVFGTTILAGGMGGDESTNIDGANGNVQGAQGILTGGTGGGGGGGQSAGTRGGDGGLGGFPGGGGGGGGGIVTGAIRSGAGGNGAGGLILVIEYTGSYTTI